MVSREPGGLWPRQPRGARLARRVAFLDAHRSFGFVYSNYVEIDGKGREIGQPPFHLQEGAYPPPEFVPRFFAHNLGIAPPTVLKRREAVETVGAHFSDRFTLLDREMYLRLAVRYPVGYLHQRDTRYRLHGANVTYRVRHLGEEEVDFGDYTEETVRRELPGLALPPRQMRRWRASARLTAALDAAERGETRRALRHLLRALTQYPPWIIEPRAMAVFAASILGSRGRRILRQARVFATRRHLHLHFRS